MRRGRLLLLGLALAPLGCKTPPPRAGELLEVLGDERRPFHATPEQTFEAFRLAFRGRLYDLEYNCLSSGFKERQGLGQVTYREARDRALGTFLVAWALWKAEVSEVEYLDDGRARLEASYSGRTVRVDLVREEFWETWGGNDRLGDAHRPWGDGVLPTAEDEDPGLWAFVPLEERAQASQVTEIRVGREWKIDHFELLDQEPES